MDFFALDIGTTTIKIVRLTPVRSGRFRLEAVAFAPTPAGGFVSANDQSLASLAEVIANLRAEARISTKNVVASLPESEVFTKLVSLPKMSINELETAITWEAEQYIPLPLMDVNYSYTVVGERQDGGIDVLIVAAPLRLVEKYEKVLNMAGLIPVALETELLACTRAVTDPGEPSTILLIDMGARSTDLAIVNNGSVLFTRSISAGGSALTRALSTNLQLDESQADQYKKTYGLVRTPDSSNIFNAMSGVLQTLVSEITRTLTYYANKENQGIHEIRIVGGSSQMPEFAAYLTSALQVPVSLGNVLLHVDDEGKGAQVSDLPAYGVAMGLAMKQL